MATIRSWDTNMPSRENAAADATPVTRKGSSSVCCSSARVRETMPSIESPSFTPSLSAASSDRTTCLNPSGGSSPSRTGSPAADGISSTSMMRPARFSGARKRMLAAIARVRGTINSTSERCVIASNQSGPNRPLPVGRI